jgi:hypothetical protein
MQNRPDVDVSFSSVSKRYFIRQHEEATSDGKPALHVEGQAGTRRVAA